MIDSVEVATWYAERGMLMLPTRSGEKVPLVDWQQWSHRAPGDSLYLFTGRPLGTVGFYMVCGAASGIIVFDADTPEAEDWLENVGGDLSTCCVRTGRGYHYWFALPDNEDWPTWDRHEDLIQFDVLSSGMGVLVPPSVNPNGAMYHFVRDFDRLKPAPEALRKPEGAFNTSVIGDREEWRNTLAGFGIRRRGER